MATATLIPKGYTFLNAKTLITVKGKKIADELLDASQKRDPDAYDMYIYNDFYSYGVLELIDQTLSTLHTKIVKKAWKDAYSILEALIMFASFEDIWTQCDDGDRVGITFKVIGACCITVLRGIKTAGELDGIHYPSLENLLENIFDLSQTFKDLSGLKGKYGDICKAIARRVFKDKSEDDATLEVERIKEWAATLEDEEMKVDTKEEIRKMEKQMSSGKKAKAWFAKGSIVDEDYDGPECKVTAVWRKYKDYLGSCPRVPLRGPPEWDLSKWTEAERMPFSFDNEFEF